jgi:hypothetical protein
MQRAITKGSLTVTKATTRLASTYGSSSPPVTHITDATGKPIAPVHPAFALPTNITDGTGKPVRAIETSSTPPPAPGATQAFPDIPTSSVPPEMDQIDIETLNTALESVPNAKPAGVSEWVHSMVGQNKTMQCLLYGVQNPVDKPGLLSKIKEDAEKWKVEGKGKWEYASEEGGDGKSLMGK